MRKDLKELAAKCSLYLHGALAYGCPLGIWTTLTLQRKTVTLSLYAGSGAGVPEGIEPQVLRNCKEMERIIRSCSAEGHAYGLCDGDDAILQCETFIKVRFIRDNGIFNTLPRFMAEVLPRLLPLTAGMQCVHCGNYTAGQGVPVRLVKDAVVPMHTACLAACQQQYDATLRPPVSKQKMWRAILACASASLLMSVVIACLGMTPFFRVAPYGIAILLVFLYIKLKGPAGYIQWAVTGSCAAVSASLGALGYELLLICRRHSALGEVAQKMMRRAVYVRIELASWLSGGGWVHVFLIPAVIGLFVVLCHWFYERFLPKQTGCLRPSSLPGKA